MKPSSKSRSGRGLSLEKTALTRKTIIEAALSEFLEQGFAGARMAAVAERSNLGKGTIYRYFTDKEALFEGVVQNVVRDAVIINHEIRDGETVGAYLHRTMLPLMEDLERSGRADIARLVVADGQRFPAISEIYRREVFEPLNEHILKYAQLAWERGELRDDTLVRHPELLVAPLWLGTLMSGVLDVHNLSGRAGKNSAAELLKAQLALVFCAR